MIITIEDFKAEYNIATDDYTVDDLQDFIDREEKLVLSQLMGANLYLLFKSDVENNNGVPTIARFLALYNEQVIDYCGYEYLYQGMKQMLSKEVYFRYAVHQKNNNTISGNMKHNHQVSSDSGYSRTELSRTWNDFKKDCDALQYFMRSNQDESEEISYPEYKGYAFKGASII